MWYVCIYRYIDKQLLQKIYYQNEKVLIELELFVAVVVVVIIFSIPSITICTISHVYPIFCRQSQRIHIH